MARRPVTIMLSCEERSELERLIRSHSTSQQLARRARMIVMAADGVGVGETADQLGVWRKGVSHWRARWLAGGPGQSVVERLQDAPRSGAPATITPEQICAIVALACERPEDSQVPLSQWSASDLAREAVRRGIVTAISPRSVGRFLKRVHPGFPGKVEWATVFSLKFGLLRIGFEGEKVRCPLWRIWPGLAAGKATRSVGLSGESCRRRRCGST